MSSSPHLRLQTWQNPVESLCLDPQTAQVLSVLQTFFFNTSKMPLCLFQYFMQFFDLLDWCFTRAVSIMIGGNRAAPGQNPSAGCCETFHSYFRRRGQDELHINSVTALVRKSFTFIQILSDEGKRTRIFLGDPIETSFKPEGIFVKHFFSGLTFVLFFYHFLTAYVLCFQPTLSRGRACPLTSAVVIAVEQEHPMLARSSLCLGVDIQTLQQVIVMDSVSALAPPM